MDTAILALQGVYEMKRADIHRVVDGKSGRSFIIQGIAVLRAAA